MKTLQLIFLLTILGQGQSLAIIPMRSLNLSSIVLLKCDLNNTNITTFFIQMALNETECPIKDCNSTISDIVNAAELHKFNTSFLANNTRSLNFTGVSLYNAMKSRNMTVDSILFYLNIFDSTFSEVYDNFISRIKEPVKTIPNLLKIVNVDSNIFLTEFPFGTDLTRLNILATGNYSLHNVRLVMKNASLGLIDMISCLPLNKIVKNLNKVNSSKLLDFVDTLGVDSKDVINFFAALNVSTNKFINYTTFTKIRHDLGEYFNKDGVLGVFRSKTQVVTSSKAALVQEHNIGFVLNYTTFYLQSPNTSHQYSVHNVHLKSGEFVDGIALINTHTPFLDVTPEIGFNYTATKMYNCTYITRLPNDTLITEEFNKVLVNATSIRVTKSNVTTYSLGSPIYCQNKMHGLASENSSKYIYFTKFKTNVAEHPHTPSSKPNRGTLLYHDFTIILLLFVVINYCS